MKKWIFLIFLVLLFIGAGVGAILWFGNFSNGERAGQVIKLSHKGLLLKTWEGQLNTGGGFNSEGDITASQWEFSVYKKPEVVEELREAMAKGARVRLIYNEKFVAIPFRGDTKYLVEDVILVEE